MRRTKLEDIGFYTLSDARCRQASQSSPLWRCEVLVTKRCNFRCPYCRGSGPDNDMTFDEFRKLMEGPWKGVLNIRLSGGEPTLVPWLAEGIGLAKDLGVRKVAISTNGSANLDVYRWLADQGLDDASVSLDACCDADADRMSGGQGKLYRKTLETIRMLSRLGVYVTAGVVLTEDNANRMGDIVDLAYSLGCSDIRLISAAQHGPCLPKNMSADSARSPILKYRLGHMSQDVSVRGLQSGDNDRCPLALDDMAVSGSMHYPCIIYLREGGAPLGNVHDDVRACRARFAREHDTLADPICRKNCLDVCRDYNNKFREFQGQSA